MDKKTSGGGLHPSYGYWHWMTRVLAVVVLLFSLHLSHPLYAQSKLFGNKKEASSSSAEKKKPSKGLFSRLREKRMERKAASIDPLPESPAGPSYSSFHGPLSTAERKNPDQVRVLILGDSQGQTAFGPELRKLLLDDGYEVIFHAVKNGTPYFWEGKWRSPVLTRLYHQETEPDSGNSWRNYSMTPRSISEYVKTYNPDVFVFQAGTNFEKDLAQQNNDYICNLISKSVESAGREGAKILWIGPPDARDNVKSPERQKRASNTLRGLLENVSEKQGYSSFFESLEVCPMSNSVGGDGEHPTVRKAIEWAKLTANWIDQSIINFECDGAHHSDEYSAPIDSSPDETGNSKLRPSANDDNMDLLSSVPIEKRFSMDLKLVTKSELKDVKTLEYTDAFAVYKYELCNYREVETQLAPLELTTSSVAVEGGTEREIQTVYVLHWAVHNKGDGPALTRVTTRKSGESFKMDLTPLKEHPLKHTIGTIYQFNEFDDFLAPVFVSIDLYGERTF